MNRIFASLLGLLLAATLFTLAPARAQTATVTVTDLHPVGFDQSHGSGASGSTQVGDAEIPYGPYNSITYHAALWTGTAASFVDLSPGGAFSLMSGVSDGTQIGYGYESGLQHALLWHGTADSLVDLNPAGFDESEATGVSGDAQVGYAYDYEPDGGFVSNYEAILWHGTAESAVRLDGLKGDLESRALAASGDTQVGTATFTFDDESEGYHAVLWHGTSDSVVSLRPAGYSRSVADGVFGDTQVGYASTQTYNSATYTYGSGPSHAILWHGTAESAVDITPPGFDAASLAGAADGVQVGSGHLATDAQPYSTHALLWRGTAASAVDLSVFLPAAYRYSSYASSVSGSGGTYDVVGSARTSDGTEHAFLWHVVVSGPVPLTSTAAALAAGPDGKTRILWNRTDGAVTIWTLNADGSASSYSPFFGPFAGWRATHISVGSDNATRILWTNTDGRMTVWTLPAGSSTPTYGPVYGPIPGWTAQSIATDNSNATHVLWTNPDGRMTLWTLPTGGGSPTYSPFFGPYAGWTAKAIATGFTGSVHLLWDNTDGRMTLWTFAGNGSAPTYSPYYGPFTDEQTVVAPTWIATDIGVDAGGSTHVLWDNENGEMTLWTVPADGSTPSYSPYFGSYAGWRAVGLSVGTGSNTHILWDNANGRITPWTLNPSSQFVGTFPIYGPY